MSRKIKSTSQVYSKLFEKEVLFSIQSPISYGENNKAELFLAKRKKILIDVKDNSELKDCVEVTGNISSIVPKNTHVKEYVT